MTGKRSIFLLLLLLGSFVAAGAQSLQGYLTLRKKHGIKQAVQVAALETLVGTRVVEVQGRVKGTFQVQNKYALLVERTDGQTEIVDCTTVPEWLAGGNEVPARLLVRASREGENSQLKAVLLGAAREDDIAPLDAAEQRRLAALAVPPQTPSSRSNVPLKYQTPPRDWNLPASEVTPIYAAYIKKVNRKLTNGKAMEIAEGIVGFSLKYGVDARLIMAMVMTESSFDPSTTSRAGAMGLGQLMPSNAKAFGLTNAYDTMQNLSATVRLVRGHLGKYNEKTGGKTFESLVLMLAAYNAGPGAVKKFGGIPPYRETQNYVRKVLTTYYKLTGRDA